METVVSNTNTSSSTEEGSGFGLAMLDFLVQVSSATPEIAPPVRLPSTLPKNEA